jgi:hypothetical protein
MSTRSVIGYVEGDGFIGRYCHWDGYPSWMGNQLWKIVRRDGLPEALLILCEENYGWSSIHADKNNIITEDGEIADSVRFGYGTAYTDTSEDEWINSTDKDNWCTEWAYAFSLTHNTMSIFHYVPGKNVWLLVTVVKVSGDEPDWNDIERIGRLMCDEYNKIG